MELKDSTSEKDESSSNDERTFLAIREAGATVVGEVLQMDERQVVLIKPIEWLYDENNNIMGRWYMPGANEAVTFIIDNLVAISKPSDHIIGQYLSIVEGRKQEPHEATGTIH